MKMKNGDTHSEDRIKYQAKVPTVSDGIVEPHLSVVDVAKLTHHPVQVDAFDEHPCKQAHVEVVQHDGYHLARELRAFGIQITNT